MNPYKYLYLLMLAAFILTALAARAEATTLFLFPESQQAGAGEELILDLKVNTEEAFINAAQGTVHFPPGVLELIEADKTGSIFNFWVEEPIISNEDGTLSFIGGTAKGVSGETLQILRLKFKARGAGTAALEIQEAVVTASDGKGTNVLEEIKGAAVTIGVSQTRPSVSPPPAVIREEPEKVVRPAIPARGLPEKPVLRVPLYPEPDTWYNQLGETIALWEVSPDVVSVATALDTNPNTDPGAPEPELFTGKNFGILEQGIWFLHVQFKNNFGWGPVANFRIAIDTTAPLPFEIEIDAAVSDNPAPEIRHATQDSLSGLKEALIFVDGREILRSAAATDRLPPQPPGKHLALVRVFDFAGNSIEDDLEFEILPLPQPTIEFVTRSVAQGEPIFIAGKSIPNSFVDLALLNSSGQEIVKKTVSPDGFGKWELAIDEKLEQSKYQLLVLARDERGALSYPEEISLRVKAPSVLTIGFIDLGFFEILVIVILLVTSGVSLYAWYYIRLREKRSAYDVIALRDLDKFSTLLETDLKALAGFTEEADPRRKHEREFLMSRISETITKMRKYLSQEVAKLK